MSNIDNGIDIYIHLYIVTQPCNYVDLDFYDIVLL